MSSNKTKPAQLFSMLYQHAESPELFSANLVNDPENTIVASRLQSSFAQEIVRLLMATVRADAVDRGEDVDIALTNASQTVLSALEEAKSLRGVYW